MFRIRQSLLLDQRNSPIETAIYWTEYVIRHKGAYHLQSPARNLRYTHKKRENLTLSVLKQSFSSSFMQYYLIDIIGILMISTFLLIRLIKYQAKRYSTQSKRIKDKIN